MASKVDGQQLQDLVCPLCLDVFKNPTLLSCGHTFCRECLEAYDEQHRRDYIVCPVCRKTTELGQNRIAGLTPNVLARGIQDTLHIAAPSQSFCPLHKNTHNDIFCQDCKEFICLTCFIDSHKDHKIKKKEALEEDLRKMRDSLINRSEMRKAQIEKSVTNAEQRRTDTHSYYSRVEKEIKDQFAKRVAILQQKEGSLLKEIDSIRKEKGNQFEVYIAKQRQVIEDIKHCSSIIKGYTGKNLDIGAVKTQYLQCSELDKSLTRSIDEETIVRLKQTAEGTRFRPSDEKLLSLGHIEVGVKETSNSEQVKTATRAIRKSEAQARKSVAVIPAPVRSKALNMVRVRQVETPGEIYGMAALSQDAVVVGYASKIHGCDRFSVSGEKTQHLKNEVGGVWGIAFLTDGRSVVSHNGHSLRVYGTHDTHSTDIQYQCKQGMYYVRLCVDQDDNIYAVNGNREIYIFHGSNPDPQRVIRTGNITGIMICVTKTGVLIISGWDQVNDGRVVTVFDREGHVGSSIKGSDDLSEYMYATVDSQDRVLVARVKWATDVLKLNRYTLQGTTLIQEMRFKELKLPCGSMKCDWYITSLQPELIAFAHDHTVYFIELTE